MFHVMVLKEKSIYATGNSHNVGQKNGLERKKNSLLLILGTYLGLAKRIAH